MRPERLDLKPERLDLRPERLDLRPERPDLGPEGSDEGGTNERTDERTNGQTKVPLCSTGLRPLRGRCPKMESQVMGPSIAAAQKNFGHFQPLMVFCNH